MTAQTRQEHDNSNQGYILRVSGTIIDAQFPISAVPDILNQLHVIIPSVDGAPHTTASLEVAQQLGDGIVRCIAIENIFNQLYRLIFCNI